MAKVPTLAAGNLKKHLARLKSSKPTIVHYCAARMGGDKGKPRVVFGARATEATRLVLGKLWAEDELVKKTDPTRWVIARGAIRVKKGEITIIPSLRDNRVMAQVPLQRIFKELKAELLGSGIDTAPLDRLVKGIYLRPADTAKLVDGDAPREEGQEEAPAEDGALAENLSLEAGDAAKDAKALEILGSFNDLESSVSAAVKAVDTVGTNAARRLKTQLLVAQLGKSLRSVAVRAEERRDTLAGSVMAERRFGDSMRMLEELAGRARAEAERIEEKGLALRVDPPPLAEDDAAQNETASAPRVRITDARADAQLLVERVVAASDGVDAQPPGGHAIDEAVNRARALREEAGGLEDANERVSSLGGSANDPETTAVVNPQRPRAAGLPTASLPAGPEGEPAPGPTVVEPDASSIALTAAKAQAEEAVRASGREVRVKISARLTGDDVKAVEGSAARALDSLTPSLREAPTLHDVEALRDHALSELERISRLVEELVAARAAIEASVAHASEAAAHYTGRAREDLDARIATAVAAARLGSGQDAVSAMQKRTQAALERVIIMAQAMRAPKVQLGYRRLEKTRVICEGVFGDNPGVPAARVQAVRGPYQEAEAAFERALKETGTEQSRDLAIVKSKAEEARERAQDEENRRKGQARLRARYLLLLRQLEAAEAGGDLTDTEKAALWTEPARMGDFLAACEALEAYRAKQKKARAVLDAADIRSTLQAIDSFLLDLAGVAPVPTVTARQQRLKELTRAVTDAPATGRAAAKAALVAFGPEVQREVETLKRESDPILHAIDALDNRVKAVLPGIGAAAEGAACVAELERCRGLLGAGSYSEARAAVERTTNMVEGAELKNRDEQARWVAAWAAWESALAEVRARHGADADFLTHAAQWQRWAEKIKLQTPLVHRYGHAVDEIGTLRAGLIRTADVVTWQASPEFQAQLQEHEQTVSAAHRGALDTIAAKPGLPPGAKATSTAEAGAARERFRKVLLLVRAGRESLERLGKARATTLADLRAVTERVAGYTEPELVDISQAEALAAARGLAATALGNAEAALRPLAEIGDAQARPAPGTLRARLQEARDALAGASTVETLRAVTTAAETIRREAQEAMRHGSAAQVARGAAVTLEQRQQEARVEDLKKILAGLSGTGDRFAPLFAALSGELDDVNALLSSDRVDVLQESGALLEALAARIGECAFAVLESERATARRIVTAKYRAATDAVDARRALDPAPRPGLVPGTTSILTPQEYVAKLERNQGRNEAAWSAFLAVCDSQSHAPPASGALGTFCAGLPDQIKALATALTDAVKELDHVTEKMAKLSTHPPTPEVAEWKRVSAADRDARRAAQDAAAPVAPASLTTILASLGALATTLGDPALTEQLPDTKKERAEELEELKDSVARVSPAELAPKVQALSERLGLDIRAAVDRKAKRAEVEAQYKGCVAEIVALDARGNESGSAPELAKVERAKADSSRSKANTVGEEQSALDALRAQAERLRVLNADPAGLAVAEGAAHVATNETARMLEFFEGTWTFFNQRLGVAGRGDRQDAARTIADEAKRLKTTDLPKAQRMLDEALGQVEAIIANPSEAAASRRGDLMASRTRWKAAVRLFNGTVSDILQKLRAAQGGEPGGEADPEPSTDIESAIGEFESIAALFNPMAFDRAVKSLLDPGEPEARKRAQREAGLRVLRRYRRQLEKSALLKTVAKTPFGATRNGQVALYAAVADLELNLHRAVSRTAQE
jgi:hypothetical protein